MHHNLSMTPYRDMVEGPLPLEAAKHALNGLTLSVESPELRRRLEACVLGNETLMTPVELHHGRRAILAFNKVDEVLAGVPRIGHDISGPEPLIASAGIPESMGRPLAVVDIPSADVNTDGQLVLAIGHQVQLIAVGNLLGALGSYFDGPPCLLVGLPLSRSVAPCLQCSRVHCHPVTEAREFLVMLPHKRSGDFSKQRQVVATSEFGKEPAERGLMGYFIWGFNPTGSSYEWVVTQRPYQGGCRGQAEVVFGQEAMPENADGVPFGSTSCRALQGSQEGGIIEAGKEGLKCLNERRRLYSWISKCRINSHDGKPQSSCRLGDSSVVITWVSVFIGTIVLNFSGRVNGKSRMNTTNSGPILCVISVM